ncbi:MAG: flagellar motor protein MotA, partial [Pseudomonadota bacterium]
MARSLERGVRFTGPGGAILNMILFLAVVGVVAYYLSPWSPQPNELLITSFLANPWLNGLIIFVLLVGIAYNINQAAMVSPAIRWVNSFRNSVDPSRTRLPRAPGMIGAMARILLDADERGGRLSQASARAILDSIGTRIDEGREFGRYAMNLLVFLGLLGTFWGLLQTVTDVSGVISALGQSSQNTDTGSAVSALINNLNEPLSGMNTAFSSSLLGLGGSLVLGFLDIQAGQAQNRFYSDLEDWISGISDNSTVLGKGGATASLEADDLGDAMATLHAAIKELNASQDQA